MKAGRCWRDYVPADAAPEIVDALSVTPEVIKFLEDLLGPYPFDAYGTIVVPFPLGFALETPDALGCTNRPASVLASSPMRSPTSGWATRSHPTTGATSG